MRKLLEPPTGLFLLAFCVVVAAIEKLSIYQNTVTAKTRSWPFRVSAIIVTLMTFLAYNTVLIFRRNVSGQAVGQSALGGIILVFLIVTILLSLAGMIERIQARIIEFIENI
jgi:hypothetical protein